MTFVVRAALVALAAGAVLVIAACGGPTGSATPSPPASIVAGTPRPASPTPIPSALVQPASAWIAYQGGEEPDGRTSLRLVHPDGSDDQPLLVGSGDPDDTGHPAWSPDGRTIAFDVFVRQEFGPDVVEIWAVDLDGGEPRRLAGCELPCLQVSYPAWSPDGTQIALARYDIRETFDWGPSAIEVLDVASGARRVVAESADGTTAYYTPRWSPDGESIAFVVETYPDEAELFVTSSSVAVVDAGGGEPTLLTEPGAFAAQPDWGPGGRIVYVTAPDGDWGAAARLESMAVDGSDPRTLFGLPAGGGAAGEPTWLPDGSILFVIAEPGGLERLATLAPGASEPSVASWTLRSPPSGPQRVHAKLQPVP